MEFKSRSQAGQDRFAFEVLGRPNKGSFLDIGANNPIDINNTYALEQMGWRGLLIDNSEESKLACRQKRLSPFMLADATKINWQERLFDNHWATHDSPVRMVFTYGGEPRDRETLLVDYLSLDVDEATVETMIQFPWERIRFRALTIEHDAYRFGNDRRDRMVKLLRQQGYEVLCADVCDQGMSFEIWAVDPTLVDMKLAERFRRDEPTDWKEFS